MNKTLNLERKQSNKSKNDVQKELHEEAILNDAIRLSKSKKKLTKDILSLIDGETVERKKNDRPDSVKLVNLADGTKLFIGIEHFLVEQVSVRKNGARGSVIKEKQKYAEKIIDEKEEYLDDPVRTREAQEKVTNAIFEIASHTNKSGIGELKESFITAWEKHLSRVEEYRINTQQLAEDSPIKIAFLIEIRCNADDVFLNYGRSYTRRRNGIYPIFRWMVEEMEKADPELLDYIILYVTNPFHIEDEDVVAVETTDIRRSLRKQGILAYEYCDDPGDMDFVKQGITDKGLEYTIEVKNKDTFGNNLISILKQAYEYRHSNLPYVAPRPIQSMMYAYGKAQFKDSSSGLILISEYPQEIAMQRFEEFVRKNPVEGIIR